MNIILECWISKKHCFLEHQRWKTVPWVLKKGSKKPISYLQDIICNIPGLIEDATNLTNSKAENTQVTNQAVLRDIRLHIDELHIWRTRWEEKYPDSYHEIPVPEHRSERPLFSTMLSFSSVLRADEITLYNTALMILLKTGTEVAGLTLDTKTAAFSLQPATSQRPSYLYSEENSLQAVWDRDM